MVGRGRPVAADERGTGADSGCMPSQPNRYPGSQNHRGVRHVGCPARPVAAGRVSAPGNGSHGWARDIKRARRKTRKGRLVPAPVSQGADLDTLNRVVEKVRSNIKRVIEGKPDVISSAITVLLAEGHLLIEDVPGVGKTMLAKSLARSIDCSVRRIQFTPDLLPSDVTGVSVYNQESREFEFRPGGVFANIVVGDEINRASPKTQSALLECMEERQVTVDGTTYPLESPFMVIATQNPIEMEGTYALPEAQRDRFMARVSMGYPVEAAEIAMLDSHTRTNPLEDLEPVTDAAEIRKLIGIVQQVYVSEAVQRSAVAISTATRKSPELLLGASPRATLHLVRAAKASAAIGGRDYVVPDDVQDLAVQVLSHRMLTTVEAS